MGLHNSRLQQNGSLVAVAVAAQPERCFSQFAAFADFRLMDRQLKREFSGLRVEPEPRI